MSWLVAGRHIVVRHPGPTVTLTVHRLLDDGAARVTVETDAPTPELQDVVDRGLAVLARPGAADGGLILEDRPTDLPDASPDSAPEGKVVLVGGGPGDPGLLTVAGLAALRSADVVVTDRLAPLGVLADLDAEIIHVGKIPRGASTSQEAINAHLVEHARAGRVVVRLKGGDGFVLGRGGEEWLACREAGIPVEVIPGVSSALAVPALAGIPVTHRGLSQAVVVVSGHVPPGDPRSDVDWAALARSGATIVVLMGVATLGPITDALITAGLAADTPAATIMNGASPQERRARAPLGEIAAVADAEGLGAPAVTVIGAAVAALDV